MNKNYTHILIAFICTICVGITASASVQNHRSALVASEVIISSDNAELSIYPNPVKAFATISFSKNIDRIVVLNIVGKEITSFIPEQGKTVISVNLSELQPGVYFIAGMSNGTKLITKRFMKEI